VRKDENLRGFISIYQVEGGFQPRRSPLTEWRQGGGEHHGQPRAGGRRAAEAAAAAGRDPLSPLWWQGHLRALAACAVCPRR